MGIKKAVVLVRDMFELSGALLQLARGMLSALARKTIDTEIKAKRNNMIYELITFRITQAKAKVKFGEKIYVDMNAKDHLSN